MPKVGSYVYVAEGFFEDCEELINRCSQVGTINYNVFCNIWKDMGFPNLYKGRTMQPEIAEFAEETLFIAKKYMVSKSSSYETSVAGLFLTYSLLNIQPFKGFASLRLVPGDMKCIKRLRDVARTDKRLDVLYILGSVLIKGPCHFHLTEREHGMEVSVKKYLEGPLSIDPRHRKIRGMLTGHNEELVLLREMMSWSSYYSAVKKDYCTSKPDPSLCYSNDKLIEELKTSYEKVAKGISNFNDWTKDNDGELARSIKSKAMTSTVGKMKHFMGVEEREKEAEFKSKKRESTDICKETSVTSKRHKAPKRSRASLSHLDKDNVEKDNITENQVEIEVIDYMNDDSTLDLKTFSGLPLIQTEETPSLESKSVKKVEKDESIFTDVESKECHDKINDAVEKLNNLPDIEVTLVSDEQGNNKTVKSKKSDLVMNNDDHLFKRPPIPKLKKISPQDLKRLRKRNLRRCQMAHLINTDDKI